VRSWFPRSLSARPRPSQAPSTTVSKRQRLWILLWCLWLTLPAVVGYVVLTNQQARNRQDAAQRHAARMDPTKNDAVATKLELAPPAGHEHDPPAVPVETGIYVTRIPKFSIVDSLWHVDFYLWFSWHGSAINPGESFKIVSGEITSKLLMRKTDEGDKHYALYRVNAEITKAFDISRFPRDEHVLTIVIEDQGLQLYQMVYTSKEDASALSSRINVSGYEILGKQTVVKPHTYKTSMGDPTLPIDYKATYSDFVMAITIARPTWGVFLKMFLPLFLAVALALAGLFVPGSAERLGIASTAMFVAVINGMSVNTMIPDTGVTTLADVLSDAGYFVIGQTIIQAILYGRFLADRGPTDRAVQLFDRGTFAILALQSVILNVGILKAASG
jgi:hypothetical protein